MAKKAPRNKRQSAIREPVSYRLLEFKEREVPLLETYPDTVERYLVVMESTWREAAELERLNCDPENLQKRYMDSFRADRDVAVEAMDRLHGSIQSIRYWMALCNWNNALIAMYDAADSHRKLLDNDYIEQLKQLRNTDAATDARSKGQRGRRARLKEYAEANGNPPLRRRRKDRTAWIRQFIDAEVSSDNKKVSDETIRVDLKSIGL